MKFSVFQLSRLGGREINEDRMGYCYTREAGLFLLADGMGGHPEGEVAAQLVLESTSDYFRKMASPKLENVSEFLEQAIMGAHEHILRYATSRSLSDTPRTTIVAAVVQDNQLTWAHCGDSRAYLVRDHELVLRTRDHSYIEQHNSGIIKMASLNRNILFTCLGSPNAPIFDISEPMEMHEGDRVLLCSDGLWDNVDDDTLSLKLSLRPVSHSVPELVELAVHRGGSHCDNVTAIAFEWETPDQSEYKVTTDTMNPQSDFSSTIQSLSDLDLLNNDLDEEEIERSIAEINEAIKRSAERRALKNLDK